MFSQRACGRCSHTHLLPLSGIDKLTEKSQVSEDGTLRSLESTSQQSSADGSPAMEVGDGDSCDQVRLGRPFLPGLCGVGWARALWGHLQQRAGTLCPGHPGGCFHRPLPCLLVPGLSPWPSDSSSINLISVELAFTRPAQSAPGPKPVIRLGWVGQGLGPGQRVLGWAVPSVGSKSPTNRSQ